MNTFRKLIGVAILVAGMPAVAVQVFVQHGGVVTRVPPLLAEAAGPDYMASADALAGKFKVYGAASDDYRVTGALAGTERPYEFTNLTGSQMTIAAGTPAIGLFPPLGLTAEVHADVFGSPPASLSTGGNNRTTNDVQATFSVKILDGVGVGTFLAQALYQESPSTTSTARSRISTRLSASFRKLTGRAS